MNVYAFHNDLKKALAIVAKKHGIEAISSLQHVQDLGASFIVTIGKELSPNYELYLANTDDKTKAGHRAYKQRYPGLCDDMLGREFTVMGKRYIYLGCITNRPKYPVAMLRMDKAEGTVIKGTTYFLDKMIEEYSAQQRKIGEGRVKETLEKGDPTLIEGAAF